MNLSELRRQHAALVEQSNNLQQQIINASKELDALRTRYLQINGTLGYPGELDQVERLIRKAEWDEYWDSLPEPVWLVESTYLPKMRVEELTSDSIVLICKDNILSVVYRASDGTTDDPKDGQIDVKRLASMRQ